MLKRPGGAGVEPRINAALRELGPILHIDPSMIELLRFEAISGTAVLRLGGNCPDCGLSAATFLEGIAAHLRRRVPEVREILNEREDPSGNE